MCEYACDVCVCVWACVCVSVNVSVMLPLHITPATSLCEHSFSDTKSHSSNSISVPLQSMPLRNICPEPAPKAAPPRAIAPENKSYSNRIIHNTISYPLQQYHVDLSTLYTPSVEKPSCLHTTSASRLSHK